MTKTRRVKITQDELRHARREALKGKSFLMLDLPLMWQVEAEDVVELLLGIKLDDGSYLWDESNREWRLDHPSTVLRMITEEMQSTFGPQKEDLLKRIF